MIIPGGATTVFFENLIQGHHGRSQRRGSAPFARMGDEDFGGRLVSEAFAWLRVQMMRQIDELLRDAG